MTPLVASEAPPWRDVAAVAASEFVATTADAETAAPAVAVGFFATIVGAETAAPAVPAVPAVPGVATKKRDSDASWGSRAAAVSVDGVTSVCNSI